MKVPYSMDDDIRGFIIKRITKCELRKNKVKGWILTSEEKRMKQKWLADFCECAQ